MKKIKAKSLIILIILVPLMAGHALFRHAELQKNATVLGPGEYFFKKDLIVKENEQLIIKPSTTLSFDKTAGLIVKGKLVAKGKNNKPIILKATDNYWQGITIAGSSSNTNLSAYWNKISLFPNSLYLKNKIKKTNILSHCNIKNAINSNNKYAITVNDNAFYLSDCRIEGVSRSGGLVATASSVGLTNNLFNGPFSEKIIKISKSEVSLTGNQINGHPNQGRYNDAIWLNSSVGLIKNNRITEVGGDGIDLDYSKAIIAKNNIKMIGDDGIDIGNNSKAFIAINKIDASPTGVQISNSTAHLHKNRIEKTNLAISVKDKSILFEEKSLFKKNKINIASSSSVPCKLSEKEYLRIKKNIEEINDELIKEQRYKDISTTKDLLLILDNSYQKIGSEWVFKSEKDQRPKAERLFSVINFTTLENHKKNESSFCNLSSKILAKNIEKIQNTNESNAYNVADKTSYNDNSLFFKASWLAKTLSSW